MLQVADYPLDDFERPKSNKNRKGSNSSEFVIEVSDNWFKSPNVTPRTDNPIPPAVDKEVQTDIDGVHYKVTSNYIQGGKVRYTPVATARDKSRDTERLFLHSPGLKVNSRKVHLYNKKSQEGPSFLVSVPSLDGIVHAYEQMIYEEPRNASQNRTQTPDGNQGRLFHSKRTKRMEEAVEISRLSPVQGDDPIPTADSEGEEVSTIGRDKNDQFLRIPDESHRPTRVRSATVRRPRATELRSASQKTRPKTASSVTRRQPLSDCPHPHNQPCVDHNTKWATHTNFRPKTPTIPHKTRSDYATHDADKPQFLVASSIKPQIDNTTHDGKYRRHIAGGSSYMNLIKQIRRPKTAPASVPPLNRHKTDFVPVKIKFKDSADCGCGTDEEKEQGKDLNCVKPPKTRLHISTKQEILRVYRRPTPEEGETMLKLDNEGYQKSLDWRKQKEAEEAQIAEDQLAEVEAEQHARAETPQTPQWQKRIEEEAEKHLKDLSAQIFVPDNISVSNAIDDQDDKLFDPKQLYHYTPRKHPDDYPPCNHANGPYGLKYWIDEINKRINQKQRAKLGKNYKAKPPKPKKPAPIIASEYTDKIQQVELNLKKLIKDNEQAIRNERRIAGSNLDEKTKEELLYLTFMDCLHLKQ